MTGASFDAHSGMVQLLAILQSTKCKVVCYTMRPLELCQLGDLVSLRGAAILHAASQPMGASQTISAASMRVSWLRTRCRGFSSASFLI